MNEQLEAIAGVQHEIWIHWMRFLFSCGDLRPDGSFLIPPEKVARWQGQMERSYSELSEEEKASDRDQAMKVMQVIEKTATVGVLATPTPIPAPPPPPIDPEPEDEDEDDLDEEDTDASDRA